MKSRALHKCIVFNKLYELRRNEKLTRTELEEKKLKKFRHLVWYAQKRSPYYRNIIQKNKIDIRNCLPEDFPILDKTILMDNFDAIVTNKQITRKKIEQFLLRSQDPSELFLGKYQVINSSGSSGNIGYHIYSLSEWLRGSTQGLRFKPLKRLFEPRKYAFYGASSGHYAGLSAVKAGVQARIGKGNDIRAYEINALIGETVEQLNAFQPEGLGGYTAALKMLGEKQLEGKLRVKLKWIETMGETATKADQAHLSKAFGCEVYNLYGCSEHLLMGVGRPNAATVLYDDDLIYEFYNDHIIVTNMLNFTLPLIRYRTADILRPLETKILEHPYIEIENVIGRQEILASFVNEAGDTDFLSSYIADRDIDGVRQLQIQPIDQLSFHFVICLHRNLNAAQQTHAFSQAEKWMHLNLQQKNMSNVNFKTIIVDEIYPDPKTRKIQLIRPLQTAQITNDMTMQPSGFV